MVMMMIMIPPVAHRGQGGRGYIHFKQRNVYNILAIMLYS